METFEQVGRAIASDLFDYLIERTRPGPTFACSISASDAARVLTPLQDLALKSRRRARETIQWYGSRYRRPSDRLVPDLFGLAGEFVVNETMPPLPFPDRFFDFVYSISIFTHLPEAMQFAWLEEINRVLKAGGEAVISTHSFGPPRKPERRKADRARLSSRRRQGRRRPAGLLSDFVPHARVHRAGMGEIYFGRGVCRKGGQQRSELGFVPAVGVIGDWTRHGTIAAKPRPQRRVRAAACRVSTSELRQ